MTAAAKRLSTRRGLAMLVLSLPALVLAVVLLVTPKALALPSNGNGNYTQILCADPSTGNGLGIAGMPEGLSNPASAVQWQITSSLVDCGAGSMSASRGIPMTVGQDNTYAQGTWSALLYEAPEFVTINAGSIYRAELATGPSNGYMGINQQGGDYTGLYAPPRNCCDQGDWFAGNIASRGTFASPFSLSNLVDLTISPDRGHWAVNATCTPNGNNNSTCTLLSGQWQYRIFGGEISLSDASDPQADSISGGMITDTPLHGIESVTFSATDQGSGLAYVKVLVDGTQVQSAVIDNNNGRCIAVAGHDAYTWAYQVPCKTSVGGRTYDFDSTLVPDGMHHVQVIIEDAAGNRSVVVDRTVETDNTSESLVGPTSPSQTGYVSSPQDGGASSGSGVKTSVSREGRKRLRIVLRIRPRRTTNKHTIYWRGQVFGGPLRSSANLLAQVKRGHGWMAFRQLAVRRGGRFSYRYRFHKTTVPTSYAFRVTLAHGRRGALRHVRSNIVRVRVSP